MAWSVSALRTQPWSGVACEGWPLGGHLGQGGPCAGLGFPPGSELTHESQVVEVGFAGGRRCRSTSLCPSTQRMCLALTGWFGTGGAWLSPWL